MRRGRVGTLLAKRIVIMVPILFGVITIAFFVTRLAGGDPAFLIAGAFSAPEVVANIQEQIGTDKPIAEQYWNFLSGIPKLDFGTSIFTGNPVEEDLGNRLPATLELIVFSLVFALIVGVAAGVFAARRRGKTGDKAVNATSFALLSLPDFWFELIRLFVFFFKLRWAPAPVGQLSANDPSRSDITGAAVIDSILSANPAALKAAVGHVALPVVALGALLAAPIARLTRSSMLEVLQADFRGSGARAVSPSRVCDATRYARRSPGRDVRRHLLQRPSRRRVLIEVIFSWGGAAQYAATAVIQNDYPAIQAFVFVAGAERWRARAPSSRPSRERCRCRTTPSRRRSCATAR